MTVENIKGADNDSINNLDSSDHYIFGSNSKETIDDFEPILIASALPSPQVPSTNVINFPRNSSAPSSLPSGGSGVSPLHTVSPALKVLEGGKSITSSPGAAAGLLSKVLPYAIPVILVGSSAALIHEVNNAGATVKEAQFEVLKNEALQGKLYSPEVIGGLIEEAKSVGVDTQKFEKFINEEYSAYWLAFEVKSVSEQIIEGEFSQSDEAHNDVIQYLDKVKEFTIVRDQALLEKATAKNSDDGLPIEKNSNDYLPTEKVDELIEYQIKKRFEYQLNSVGEKIQKEKLSNSEFIDIIKLADTAGSEGIYTSEQIDQYRDSITQWQSYWSQTESLNASDDESDESIEKGWTYNPDKASAADIRDLINGSTKNYAIPEKKLYSSNSINIENISDEEIKASSSDETNDISSTSIPEKEKLVDIELKDIMENILQDNTDSYELRVNLLDLIQARDPSIKYGKLHTDWLDADGSFNLDGIGSSASDKLNTYDNPNSKFTIDKDTGSFVMEEMPLTCSTIYGNCGEIATKSAAMLSFPKEYKDIFLTTTYDVILPWRRKDKIYHGFLDQKIDRNNITNKPNKITDLSQSMGGSMSVGVLNGEIFKGKNSDHSVTFVIDDNKKLHLVDFQRGGKIISELYDIEEFYMSKYKFDKKTSIIITNFRVDTFK